FWALFFIALLYLTAPATAAFARYFMIESLHGKTEQELPDWYHSWGKQGFVLWFDDGDGKLEYYGEKNAAENEVFRAGKLTPDQVEKLKTSHALWLSSAKAQGEDARVALREKKLSGPDRDIIVLATPQMANLAGWIIAFVAAGGLAAALSTASGLLLVISSSVAHDLYFRVINPSASERSRLFVGRAVIGVAVIIAGIFGIYPPGFVSQVVAFAFGLAAASFFPAIVLGIFSKRVGSVPALAGMTLGMMFTASYIIGAVYFEMPLWCFGIKAQGIGSVGMLVNFGVTLGLAPFFPAPSGEAAELIDKIREPELEEES
ncbi:MAG: cation acetate symporter, partial [Planctomycetota bacterium]